MYKFLLSLILLSFFSACKKDSECPPHYTGKDCNTQITPTTITIEQVTVTKAPYDNGGVYWDPFDDPDPLFIVVDAKGNTVFESPILSDKKLQGATLDTAIPLTDVKGVYFFKLYDHDDFGADDYVGGLHGQVYTDTGGFPTTLKVDCNNCNVSFEFKLKYYF